MAAPVPFLLVWDWRGDVAGAQAAAACGSIGVTCVESCHAAARQTAQCAFDCGSDCGGSCWNAAAQTCGCQASKGSSCMTAIVCGDASGSGRRRDIIRYWHLIVPFLINLLCANLRR